MKVAIFFALVAVASAGNIGLGLGLAPAGVGIAHTAAIAHAPVAVAHAPVAVAHAPIAAAVGIANTGHSVRSQSANGLGGYAFGYNEGHATGGTYRRESGAPGVQVGSYGLRVADGRVRNVNYVADALGFRAQVSTNEPGTAPSVPAHAPTNVAVAHAPVAAVAHAPVAVAAAPAAVKVHAAAPIYGAGIYGAALGHGYGLGYGYGGLGYGYGGNLGLAYSGYAGW